MRRRRVVFSAYDRETVRMFNAWAMNSGLTGKMAAKMLGVDSSYFYRVRAEQQRPSLKMVRMMQRVLDNNGEQ